jgi:hypothetical protein
MAKVSELPSAPGGPEPRTPEFLPYRPDPRSVVDHMRRCSVSGCENETAWLVGLSTNGLSRIWYPRCAQHKLFGFVR